MSERDISAFIGHVVMAMRFVADFIEGMTLDDFLADRKTRDAVIRNCEVIGEAIKHIPDEFRTQHPSVDWSGLAGLRDVLIHQYFGVDYVALWNIVAQECPVYCEALAALPECPALPENLEDFP